MNAIDPTELLGQLHTLAAGAAQRPQGVAGQPAPGAADFASILGAAINEVNAQQQTAAQLATSFDLGTPGVDLTQVMIESQKAALSFRAMSEVRNKLVSAYQDIMNMPL